MVRPIPELIERACEEILPVLRENGIPKEPACMKVAILAQSGSQDQCLNRMEEFLIYLEEHEDKINATEFRELTIELLEKYPE